MPMKDFSKLPHWLALHERESNGSFTTD
jgi:hypothetical protein